MCQKLLICKTNDTLTFVAHSLEEEVFFEMFYFPKLS